MVGKRGVHREREGKPGRAMVREKKNIACFHHSQILHIRSMRHENTRGVKRSEETHHQEVRVWGCVMGVTWEEHSDGCQVSLSTHGSTQHFPPYPPLNLFLPRLGIPSANLWFLYNSAILTTFSVALLVSWLTLGLLTPDSCLLSPHKARFSLLAQFTLDPSRSPWIFSPSYL